LVDSSSAATASDTWPHETPPQLLAESTDDMGRLSALVAALNQSATSPAEELRAETEPEAETLQRPRSLLWGWLLVAALAVVVVALLKPWDMNRRTNPAVVAASEGKVVTPTRVETKVPVATQEKPVQVQPVEEKPAVVVQPLPVEPAIDPAVLKQEVERASKLYLSGKLKEALVAVDAALVIDPRHAPALLLKANVLIEREDLEAAKQAADAAIASDPGLADAQLALGVIEQERGATDAAIAAYETFLELAPKSRYAASIRGTLKQLQRGK